MTLNVVLLCLALNVYFEARGEPLEGQYAVAEVTLRRASISGRGVCNEVFSDRQFSWTLDERPTVENKRAWATAQGVALGSTTIHTNYSKGATHFHAVVYRGKPLPKPKWAHQLCRTAVIGNHIFYKPCE